MDKDFGQIWATLRVFSCGLLLLSLQTCFGQKDCTGVDCPVLDNCIKEVLEKGACCATCLQRGCSCEGYQYYDCVSAGFKEGKVPEGQSYLVDFGSTECSCPDGGGKIGCDFILCPEIPANCIDFSESSERCPHCLRIGCIHRNQRYEAGHSFHMDPCQVCHCPNDGGDLMCSPIPNCNPEEDKKPLKPTAESEEEAQNWHNEEHKNELPDYVPSKDLHKFPSNSLPHYTENSSEFDETEDYDYSPETAPTSSPGVPVGAALPAFIPESQPSSHYDDGLRTDPRKELRERVGTYEATEATKESPASPLPKVPTTTTQELRETQTSTSKRGLVPETSSQQTTQRTQTEQQKVPSRTTTHTAMVEENTRNSIQHTQHHTHREEGHGNHHRGNGRHVKHTDSHLASSEHNANTSPKTQSIPTTSPATTGKERATQRTPQARGREEKDGDRKDLFAESEDQGVSSSQMLDVCCGAGEKWASDHGHCSNMDPVRMNPVSVCWSVQSQCCRGSLRDRQCGAGVRTAREGRTCGAAGDDDDVCGSDVYKECCSCCALGLRLLRDGTPCEAPRGLGQPCSHALLTCCQGSDTSNRSMIRERAQPHPTSPPRKVSDSPDRQAMSLDEGTEVENAVDGIEGLQDVDECEVYEGQLCQQECINTPGSYTCTCFPGYTLRTDGIHCLKVTTDEENSLKEHALPTAPPNPERMPTTPPPALLDPCEGNGPCAQICSPAAGRPLCSCFPGFSLLPDGHSCEDVDECALSLHSCEESERCVNTVGQFSCERLIVCPAGYQRRGGVCEDINECTVGAHNCGLGFECINSAGSFICRPRLRCDAGFTFSRGQCVDIDECRTVTQPCSPGFNCVNTIGSYTCQRKIIMCGRGYHASPDGSRCIDVDECQTGVHRCGEGQLCHNLPGTYRCDCRSGYQYDTFRKMCVDVNECWRYPGRLCAQTCENTPGSYHCSCTSGFTLSSDGKNCEDVNECLNKPCSQECANVYGSFQCYCKQGYYLREDGLTCDDVDECSRSIGHLCAFKCVNVPGSYKCACPEHGYSMSPNGRSCRDIDECGLGAHNCTAEETCYNIYGGFRCLSFQCPSNFRRVSDTRCERISCSNFGECQNTPVRITYYQLSFQTNIIIPAQIFRIGPSPAYTGDNIILSITRGNEDGFFSTRKLNAYTGAIYLHHQVQHPRDFLIDVEMKLWRQGTFTTFIARIYVFITANVL
ncbi:fibulin-2 [Astyanax mexicanus]|uniref:Fibulin-2 n=1 Tax=Astyanax mexicanus TaxID=7994 RepID=A0A8T2LLY6_ASTMX|nr:fibulin-2 [Astyanax mexicanus]